MGEEISTKRKQWILHPPHLLFRFDFLDFDHGSTLLFGQSRSVVIVGVANVCRAETRKQMSFWAHLEREDRGVAALAKQTQSARRGALPPETTAIAPAPAALLPPTRALPPDSQRSAALPPPLEECDLRQSRQDEERSP